MDEVRLTQENVLDFLKHQTSPCSVTDIRFMLDAFYGNVYPRSHVIRVLLGLERKGEVRSMTGGYWEYIEQFCFDGVDGSREGCPSLCYVSTGETDGV